MRALTLYPHWAHAILGHGKCIENRAGPIPAGLVGARVALHAGAFRPGRWWDDVRQASGGTVPRGVAPVPLTREDRDWHAPFAMRGPWRSDTRHMQCRAIVGTAVLVEHIDAATRRGDGPGGQPWGDDGAAWWWGLADVRILPEAIPWRRGRLGLWRLPEDVAAQLGAV